MQIARALSLIGCASSELQFLGGDDVGILQGLSHAERSHHLGLGASILHRLGEKCFDLLSIHAWSCCFLRATTGPRFLKSFGHQLFGFDLIAFVQEREPMLGKGIYFRERHRRLDRLGLGGRLAFVGFGLLGGGLRAIILSKAKMSQAYAPRLIGTTLSLVPTIAAPARSEASRCASLNSRA
jgi:hypothetical protein